MHYLITNKIVIYIERESDNDAIRDSRDHMKDIGIKITLNKIHNILSPQS